MNRVWSRVDGSVLITLLALMAGLAVYMVVLGIVSARAENHEATTGATATTGTTATVCHMPGTPAQQELTVDDDAYLSHLGHGDTPGPCPGTTGTTGTTGGTTGETTGGTTNETTGGTTDETTGGTTDETTDGTTDETTDETTGGTTTGTTHTVCHKPGTPEQEELTVDDDALPAHVDHGDTLGSCEVLDEIIIEDPDKLDPVGRRGEVLDEIIFDDLPNTGGPAVAGGTVAAMILAGVALLALPLAKGRRRRR